MSDAKPFSSAPPDCGTAYVLIPIARKVLLNFSVFSLSERLGQLSISIIGLVAHKHIPILNTNSISTKYNGTRDAILALYTTQLGPNRK